MESKYKSKFDIRDYLEGKSLNDQSIRSPWSWSTEASVSDNGRPNQV
ncbi:hypothetical protein LCGC14_1738380 [marine sediment metagenome]|uniref:Uncharacterized protein n=1 Tax=marine sediment metagenome TaxID=412755 RepID=A0A0F9H7C9_9ZZZZ